MECHSLPLAIRTGEVHEEKNNDSALEEHAAPAKMFRGEFREYSEGLFAIEVEL